MGNSTISNYIKYKPLKNYVGLEGRIKVKHKDVFVGVELEIEGVDDHIVIPNSFGAVEDNSLKINGLEIVSIPIKLKYLEVELNRVLNPIKDKILLSSRCSTHIHMNVRDMTVEQINNMVMLYMIFEKSLYKLSGNRWNNNFCVPLFMCQGVVENWFKYEHSMSGWDWYKYTGLNLRPMFSGDNGALPLGTAEFRQLHGTIDVPEIINWCNLITSLKRAAQSFQREDLLAHIRIMKSSSGYFWLANQVFGGLARQISSQPTFIDDVESCLTVLNGVLPSIKPIGKAKEAPIKSIKDKGKSTLSQYFVVNGDTGLVFTPSDLPMPDAFSTPF